MPGILTYKLGLKLNCELFTKCFKFNEVIPRKLSSNNETKIDIILKAVKDDKPRNVVVMAGAGISTPSGIPDFRSPKSGLYDNLQKYNLPYPEAIFDIDYFRINNKPFFALAKEMYPGNFKPNCAHYFVKLLHDKRKLLRMYTQNIDGLERLAGIPSEKLVEAHGSFSTAACMKCKKAYLSDDIKNDIFEDKVPLCSNCQGVIKPNIVFFGEMLPDSFFLHIDDMSIADLLIIMGTSLVVHPFASIADAVNKITPRLLINKEMAGSVGYRDNDVIEIGDVEDIIMKIITKLGWEKDLEYLQRK